MAVIERGIVIEIRPKEKGHHVSHIHAHFQGENISISLVDGTVLAGNISKKNEKIAVNYVRSHMDELLNDWTEIHGELASPNMYAKRPHN
ncbi:MAG: DUF4160 domain-containing protein [Erysipelotrichaceae bacterium]|nr:DUF4160 domain-containing protein [Erysipelotrichaceae bacterium]